MRSFHRSIVPTRSNPGAKVHVVQFNRVKTSEEQALIAVTASVVLGGAGCWFGLCGVPAICLRCACTMLHTTLHIIVFHTLLARDPSYNEPMRVHSVVQAVCDLKISFGEGGENKPSRPFGVALLLAGVDKDGTPSLFSTDPSGTYLQYDAKSIGSGSEGAETILKVR